MCIFLQSFACSKTFQKPGYWVITNQGTELYRSHIPTVISMLRISVDTVLTFKKGKRKE